MTVCGGCDGTGEYEEPIGGFENEVTYKTTQCDCENGKELDWRKVDSEIKETKNLIKEKSKQWMNIIDGVVDNIKDESPDEIKSIVKKYKEKLKKFRNCGLEKGGEMSLENLVFKLLRRNGYIEKLYNIPTELIDKKLSMNQ